MEDYVQVQTYYALLMTINVTLTLVVMLVACLCCKKKIPKNDLLGLEGMVKMKNPDEVIVITTVGKSESQVDLSTISNADSEKRASTAAHRSLPDIPVADVNGGDNGSELYETVAEKRLMDAQNNLHKSPIPSLKKQTSVSQHSSISQADDVSSPYSRVKNSPHDYAKVRSTEHPYAQLNAPSTSGAAAAAAAAISAGNSSQLTLTESLNRNSSHHSSDSSQNLNDSAPQAEIPAASAIAGMISASQDLPYMTPPIANQQHFSGDSQDSSKGYTSISVREPIANILAQQPPKSVQRNAQHSSDSHYATVSDDSDETYAAIEDPNGRNNPNAAADIYTSGSETYAQIQPMQVNSIVVAVEINNSSATNNLASSALSGSVERGGGSAALPIHSSNVQSSEHNSSNVINTSSAPGHHPTTIHSRPSSDHATPIPPPVDSLRAQIHSRQASSSSNNSSSMGNLGSPKPEKRQANSPLPPTPKSNQTNSSSNLASGRNSVISVIELSGVLEASGGSGSTTTIAAEGGSPQKRNKSLSPSKDIEGMYAKVMKKNKFSRNSPSSQNNSPIMTRKYNDHSSSLGVSPLDSAAAELIDLHKIAITTSSSTIDKSRTRSNSYSSKDHGYETIPADGMRGVAAGGLENRKSDCYANILQKERQQEGAHNQNASSSINYSNAKPTIDTSDSSSLSQQQKLLYHSEKHYETIAAPRTAGNGGYETLLTPKNQTDPVNAKKSNEYDPNYEVLKGPKYATANTNANNAGLSDDGYAKVVDKKRLTIEEEEDSTDGYSKVKGEECDDGAIGGYSTIGEVKGGVAADATDANHNYASISETKARAAGVVTGGNDELLETDSDHYARIAEERLPSDLQLSSVATPAKTGDDILTPVRLPELPIASPSSVNSSSLMNHSGSTNLTTTSSTTMSSRQTPSSSQYESLTGSDTDPNYESVCYLNTSQENPYERLQPDNCSTDTQLSSPLTPDDERTGTSVEPVPPVKSPSSNGPLKVNATTADFNSDVVVDDYFQV